MKKKYLIRKKQLYNTEIEALCATASILNELFKFSHDTDNQNHFSDMINDITELLVVLSQNNSQFVEKVPLNGRKESE